MRPLSLSLALNTQISDIGEIHQALKSWKAESDLLGLHGLDIEPRTSQYSPRKERSIKFLVYF